MGEALELIRAAIHSPSRPRRLPIEGVVRIRCEGRRGLHTGFLRDLSLAGMFVRILDPELAGSRVDFDLDVELGGHRHRISGRGEVLWCRASYEGPSRPPGMGVRFTSLEQGSHEVLVALLAEGGGGEEEPLIDPVVPPSHAWPPVQATSGGEDPPSIPSPRRFQRWLPWVPVLLAAGLAGWLLVWWIPYQPRGTGRPDGVTAESSVLPVAQVRPGHSTTESRVRAEPPFESQANARPELSSASSREVPGIVGLDDGVTELPLSLPLPAMTRLTGIRWERAGEATHLILEGDGALEAARVRSSGIGGEFPRRVLRLLEVTGQPEVHEVATSELLRVRTGYHDTGAGELHVVLDLAGPEVITSAPELEASGLRITLRAGPAPAP